MVDLTQITLTGGVPSSGDGTVATINALMADGGLNTVGHKADAAATQTDGTAITAMSVWKQISKSLQTIAALIPSALAGTGGLKVQGDGTALPVSIASIPSHAVSNSGTFKIQESGGHTVSASVTPAAAARTANDVVGGAITFPNIAPSAAELVIENVSLMINRNAVQASEGAYRLHLYNVTPPSNYANAAFDLPSGDQASYLGFVDITVPIDLGSTCYVQITGLNRRIKTSSANIYGYLVTIAAYTETAVAHTVTLHAREV